VATWALARGASIAVWLLRVGFDSAEFDLAAVNKALEAFAWADSPLRPAH
jgi:hypothetical protein